MDPLPPADDPILICSLPQPPSYAPPPEQKTDRKPKVPEALKGPIQSGGSKGSRRRSRGVQLRSSDSEEQKTPVADKNVATTAPGPPIKGLKEEDEEKSEQPAKKVGSCGKNGSGKKPATTLKEALMLLQSLPDNRLVHADPLEVAAMMGYPVGPPAWHRPGGYNLKNATIKGLKKEDKGEESGKSRGANACGKKPVFTFEDALMVFQQYSDRSLENADILEVAAKNGFLSAPPRSHRPG